MDRRAEALSTAMYPFLLMEDLAKLICIWFEPGHHRRIESSVISKTNKGHWIGSCQGLVVGLDSRYTHCLWLACYRSQLCKYHSSPVSTDGCSILLIQFFNFAMVKIKPFHYFEECLMAEFTLSSIPILLHFCCRLLIRPLPLGKYQPPSRSLGSSILLVALQRTMDG
jgi:hypothetical protein